MNLEADEFIKFAAYVRGSDWRNTLSAELKVDRRSLVLLLASDEPIPDRFANHVLDKIEDKLLRDSFSLKAFRNKVARIKDVPLQRRAA